jgi:hypothetical protein
MARHIARWQPAEHSSPQSALPHRSPADWLAEVQVLRAFAEARHEHVWDDLQASFKLGALATLRVADTPGLLGVETEGLALPSHGGDRSARFFTRLPMRLSLRLATGWRLAGWENNIGPGGDGRFILKGDTILRPQLVFEPSHRPMFQSIKLDDDGRLRLVFYGLAGRAHYVETSADLVAWQRLKTVAVPDREPLSLVVPFGGEPGRRFFRVLSEAE